MNPFHLLPVLIFLLATPGAASARTLHQWVQLGPNGAGARAITDGTDCPTLTVDGPDRPMAPRSDASQELHGSSAALPKASFPVRGCEATIEATAVAASIAGVALPLPKPNPARVVIFG